MELIGYELEKAKEDKRKGMITTILIHVLLLLVMIFLFKFIPPDPPIEEQGIAINFGTSDQGMGEVQPTTNPSPTPSPEKESAKATPTPVKSSPSEKVMTSDDPEAVNLKVKDTPKAPKDKPKPEEVKKPVVEKPKEPVINKDALYPGKRPGGSNASEGETGKPGDQGSKDGDKDATSHTGMPGKGSSGAGISFDLGGRGSLSLPKPSYTSDKYGRVVVDITVDENGNVIKAKAGGRGTTVSDTELFKRAEEAALKAKFSKGNTEKQIGTITYNFIRN